MFRKKCLHSTTNLAECLLEGQTAATQVAVSNSFWEVATEYK